MARRPQTNKNRTLDTLDFLVRLTGNVIILAVNNSFWEDKMKQDMIVILDLGSENNTAIARAIRSLGVYN